MSKSTKMRLDKHLFERGLAPTRSQAEEMIERGMVAVNGVTVKKTSLSVDENDSIVISGPKLEVSRSGAKLKAALDSFGINPEEWTILDVGASTGGFTQVVLDRGAKKVFAVDVGTSQLHPKLREDPRVFSLEQQDIRELTALPGQELVHLVVVDVSFISIKLVLPHLKKFLRAEGTLIVLFKPQFEVGARSLSKKGVVKDKWIVEEALWVFRQFCQQEGITELGFLPSPLEGKNGNQEFLFHLRR